jgi:small-conductance mechanosensitive channel
MIRWTSAARRAVRTALGAVAVACAVWLAPWFASSSAAQSEQPARAAVPPAVSAEAGVTFHNRTVAVLRAPQYGLPAGDRARRAGQNIAEALDRGGPGEVEAESTATGSVIKVDGRFAFLIQPDDVDRVRGESLEDATRDAVRRLDDAIAASRESRDLAALLRSAAWSAAATAVAALLLIGLGRLIALVGRRLVRLADTGAERIRLHGTALLQRERLVRVAKGSLRALYWTLVALVVYQWLSVVLASFPYTRPWGEQLTRFLIGALAGIAAAIVRALPDLVIATLIFLLAAATARALGAFLDRAARLPGTLSWLDEDTVGPARRMANVAIWLFALAMAYPYLPGSGTEAFKGLSVLVGLMISLGGSSLVGQAASGMVLMYTRTLRVGEYVEIGGHEGTIVGLGTFTTRIRTGRGEELTLPNAMVMANVTRNYSRTVGGRGFVLDTEVTIGYDTPWRQVHAMLVEAARRTPGVVGEPAPRVFQTALSDFYPQYRLVCQALPADPRPRAEMLSALHANIQDVFNEHGVQIMSPHYLGDPDEAKVVPPSRWWTPPADDPGAPKFPGTRGAERRPAAPGAAAGAPIDDMPAR